MIGQSKMEMESLLFVDLQIFLEAVLILEGIHRQQRIYFYSLIILYHQILNSGSKIIIDLSIDNWGGERMEFLLVIIIQNALNPVFVELLVLVGVMVQIQQILILIMLMNMFKQKQSDMIIIGGYLNFKCG
ncbi:unnamed protein product [Paramecium primaurelia]|uniref:Transmembrane protein n=1 Tax=Paramecium primaurelia TaxID=5886 RepID=A0A8S1NQ56_PARPR|nr:unnamed protein product [Paramecium primaurelia]